MAKDAMDSGYYPGDDESSPSQSSDDESQESPEQDNAQEESDEGDEGETALLPKSLFGGDCKPGDKYTVEVVHVYDDELEVKPSGKAAADDNSNRTEDSPMMAGAMDKLGTMTS